MNILFIEKNLSPTNGGIERVTHVLYKEFRKKGISTYICYYANDDAIVPESDKFQIPIEDDVISTEKKLLEIIEKLNINIIILQNYHYKKFKNLYARIKEKTNIKLLAVMHHNPDLYINKDKFGLTFNKVYFRDYIKTYYYYFHNKYKDMHLNMYEIADKYILLAPQYINTFKKLYKVPTGNLATIGNPCPNVPLTNYADKENIVVIVSRMDEQQKRISKAIKLWEELTKSNNSNNWKLYIVGSGPNLNDYKKMAANIPDIVFTGKTQDPNYFYKKAKIFLMTSMWEGLSMSLIEAMKHGCVPICYNSFDSVYDTISDSRNGYIIEYNDKTMFINKLKYLIKNPEELEKMSALAIEDTNKKYNTDIIVEKWVNLFYSL